MPKNVKQLADLKYNECKKLKTTNDAITNCRVMSIISMKVFIKTIDIDEIDPNIQIHLPHPSICDLMNGLIKNESVVFNIDTTFNLADYYAMIISLRNKHFEKSHYSLFVLI